jgi:hypothetical protein
LTEGNEGNEEKKKKKKKEKKKDRGNSKPYDRRPHPTLLKEPLILSLAPFMSFCLLSFDFTLRFLRYLLSNIFSF